MKPLTVKEFIEELGKKLELQLVSGKRGLNKEIVTPQINRLGLALVGHFSYFPSERIQICGMTEHTFLQNLPHKDRLSSLGKLFSTFPQIPAVVVVRNITPLNELIETTEEYNVPLLTTTFRASTFITETTVYLEEKLAPRMLIHGVLVDVYGIGVLILGESGIGKSECALELLKRGHMLIADDVIEIIAKPGGTLIGKGKEITQHFMEVRGLGIIDIHTVFGVGSILDRTRIEMVIKLEEWKDTLEVDRLDFAERKTTLLGVEVPEITLPIKPGRNIAVLIEVAALNQRLKQKGYRAAEELDKKVIESMTKK